MGTCVESLQRFLSPVAGMGKIKRGCGGKEKEGMHPHLLAFTPHETLDKSLNCHPVQLRRRPASGCLLYFPLHDNDPGNKGS